MRRLLVLVVIIGGLCMGVYFIFAGNAETFEKVEVGSVVDDVLAARANAIVEGNVDFGSESEVNVLLLGLDGRKGETEPHCDAVHMFTLNIVDWTLRITSVPRGTYVYIPPGTYEAGEYYIANACAYAGLDYGISEIEKIVGVKADYVVTVGFSQVLGIARIFDLPTTETLEWLRTRQYYAIGEPQRTRNQAEFMKDMIVSQLYRFRSGFTAPFQYLIYSMVDTDMDFSTARALLEGYLASNIDDRPEDITIELKPYYETTEYHFDPENASEQMSTIYAYISTLLSIDDFSGKSVEDIQNELVAYLKSRIESREPVGDLFEQQIWLQIEEEESREGIHFDLLKRYIENLSDDEVINVVSDYILEKSTLGIQNYADAGKELLEARLSQ